MRDGALMWRNAALETALNLAGIDSVSQKYPANIPEVAAIVV